MSSPVGFQEEPSPLSFHHGHRGQSDPELPVPVLDGPICTRQLLRCRGTQGEKTLHASCSGNPKQTSVFTGVRASFTALCLMQLHDEVFATEDMTFSLNMNMAQLRVIGY
ncbi:hypothetical protein ILYODFUR_026630 [Ilyodon furcidens]|uniref:Uncharacterized protein n=1 Tax=Ilyodon furcidens TaxID=33524 RepID=A0ABV0UMF7_9TELE